jgi:transposase
MMSLCKKCSLGRAVKNGVIAGKQRYKCKECGCSFRDGDNRTNDKIAAKKALCILLYAMAKGPYRMLGRILGIHNTLVCRWVRSSGESLSEPDVPGGIEQWNSMKCGIS